LKRLAPGLIAGVLLFGIAVGLQGVNGSLQSDIGASPDEPAHVVTGLMVHDYLAQRDPAHPIDYAKNYYLHYPKVAIGQWPPAFYVLQASWGFVFGSTRTSLLMLMAVMSAASALLVFLALRRDAGQVVAALSALLLLVLPMFQRYGGEVMTEVPLALFGMGAALSFARYVDTGRARYSWIFGLCAVLAILTKGNGLLLALLPPLAVLMLWRWDLLKRPSFWIPPVLVALLCGPWYVLTLDLVRSSWAGGAQPTGGYFRAATQTYGVELARMFGVVVGLTAAVGAALALRARTAKGTSLVALVIATLAFHVAVPSSIESRHLVLLAPAVLWLFGSGAAFIGRRLPLGAAGPALCAVTLVAAFGVSGYATPRKQWGGYAKTAEYLRNDAAYDDAVFLVSSDSRGEGAYVAETALGDERPGHIVLRATKVLSRSGWLGQDYEVAFETPQEMMAYLKRIPVAVVVLDTSPLGRGDYSHHRMLRELLEANAHVWEPLATFDAVRDGRRHKDALRLYRQRGFEQLPRAKLDVEEILGKDIPD